MNIAKTCLAAFLGLVVAAPRPATAQSPFISSSADDIKSFLQHRFAAGSAGMVIGLIDEHEARVFSAGKLDNGTGNQVDGDSIFALGSVTKVFTSLLLLDSVRRGEMRLDDPVSRYLPARVTVPTYNQREITLANLAAQDSGLPFHPHDTDKLLDPQTGQLDLRKLKAVAEAITADDLYAAVTRHKLSQNPGQEFQYSNAGMALLGRAIELTAGNPYESLVVDRICSPLKMRDTKITLTDEQRLRLASGHFSDGTRVGHWNFQAMAPAGSLFSTANDMLKFLAAQLELTEVRFTPQIKASQVVRHASSPGFGKTAWPWYDNGVYNPPGSELMGHAGHGYGGLAFIAIDAQRRRGVVVLTNQLKIHPNPIGWTLLQQMPFSRQNLTYAVREVVGVGVWLAPDPKTGLARISIAFPESPAGKADLRSGQLIRAINGNSTKGKTAQQCNELMPGPVGTTVRLDLVDPNDNTASSVNLRKARFLTVVGKADK